MLENAEFQLLIASLPDHDRLVAEIYFRGKFVGLVSQERGDGLFDVETPGVGLDESQITHRVDLLDFVAAIEHARSKLSA